MGLEETDPNKQDYLARLNSLLNNMCFPAYSPNYSKMYSICYNMFCQAIDNISTELPIIKSNYNLPPDSEDYPNSDEFERRYEEWRRENELVKQAEQDKKNRLESLKGKESKDSKGGGKATAGAKKEDKKDKKDEGKKKTTPTPSAKNTRPTVVEKVTSRSASRNKANEKSDELSRTHTKLNQSVLSEEEFKLKLFYDEKAYVGVYQELSKMVDNLETIFSEIVKESDVEERLSILVFQSSAPVIPLNSDYID
jgi:hypothetical protein